MIAIKDVEMPKNCGECPMTTCKGKDEPWNYVCSINLKDIDFNKTKRAEHCPLVEIVTCKDCEHCKKDMVEGIEYLWCKKDSCATSEDYYCGGGRRESKE